MQKHRLMSTSKRLPYQVSVCWKQFYSLPLTSHKSQFPEQFKSLEAMAEQVRPEGHSTYVSNSSSNKMDKHASRRGSGSPFKCIGLGLAQQMKSEKDEDLSAARIRIEELESLAVSRQKEVQCM